jgi:HD superfamily phosphohydrolase
MKLTGYDFGGHTIQDPIHGGITFGPIEKSIIDHTSFQRLRGLRQNSLLHLIFPSANHTRFDHSVGVMFLADRLLESLLSNQRRICKRSASRTDYQEPYRVDGETIEQVLQRLEEDQYYKLILRIAALFHDIGHGPLSHLFDKFFPTTQWIDSLRKKPSTSIYTKGFGNYRIQSTLYVMKSCLARWQRPLYFNAVRHLDHTILMFRRLLQTSARSLMKRWNQALILKWSLIICRSYSMMSCPVT